MAIIDVIGLELDNKCMPKEMNVVGVHEEIYVCLCDMYVCLIRV